MGRIRLSWESSRQRVVGVGVALRGVPARLRLLRTVLGTRPRCAGPAQSRAGAGRGGGGARRATANRITGRPFSPRLGASTANCLLRGVSVAPCWPLVSRFSKQTSLPALEGRLCTGKNDTHK